MVLVRLFNTVFEIYELTTSKTKYHLAEESGIWRVSYHNNKPSQPTMKKYLSIETIPKKNPRWTDIFKAARFVLSLEEITTEQRIILTEEFNKA